MSIDPKSKESINLPPEGKTSNTENPPILKPPQAHKTPKEELHVLWKELVQNQRIHEMVKCLQQEKQKLKILHSNFEGKEDFLDFATQRVTDKIAADRLSQERQSNQSQQSPKVSGEVPGTAPRPGAEKDLEEDPAPAAGREESDTSFTSSRLNYKRSTLRSRSAEVNKHVITDQEFEDIVELCEDKVEQKVLREAYEEKKAREKYLHNADERRMMLYDFINSRFFTNFMLITIITSIVGIFLLTFESISIRYAWPLIILDACIIGIFIVEAILKVLIYTDDYFKQLWNLLDMTIIIVHIVEIAVDLITRTLALSTDINANIGFKFLKSLRALRLLRVIKFLPNLQVIVATVFQSMLSIGSIAVLMLLFIFVFAVMGRGLFYDRNPEKFGNLWLSFVTLFQLLTLDDWFELLEEKDTDLDEYEDDVEKVDVGGYWLTFGYLFAYLVMEYFVFLNLFVAVLVDNFQLTLADVEIQKQREAQEELENQKKFEDLKHESIDPSIAEVEHQRHLRELEQLGLFVEDYFPIEKDSKEADAMSEFFKNLNSLDFERFLWKRRSTLFNMITDTALNSRQNVSIRHESESSSDEDGGSDQPKRKTMEEVAKNKLMQKKISVMKEEYLPSRYSFESGEEDDE